MKNATELLAYYHDKKCKVHKQVNQAIITHDKDLQAYSEGRMLEIDNMIHHLQLIVSIETKTNTIQSQAVTVLYA
jgi:hypothetical protein